MKFLLKLIPPLLLDIYLRYIKSSGWSGNYKNWELAKAKSTGYDENKILSKVLEATKEVVNGKAAYEKDSVLFYDIQFNWPVLSILLLASQNNTLNVIDFGGSLGSTYFQHISFFKNINHSWKIIEQAHFVETGKAHFQNDFLSFHQDIRDALFADKCNVLLFACVLQYLEKPYQLLNELVTTVRAEYVILDRVAWTNNNSDKITLQQVPKHIYSASYPAWFLNKNKVLEIMSENYNLLAEYPCNDKPNIPGYFSGMIYKLK